MAWADPKEMIRGATRSLRTLQADELASLEGPVVEVFGAGDRSTGWWIRKLRREVVDPQLSTIAVDDRGRRIGFILSSAPASLGDVARLVSLGVVQTARRRGTGRALIEAAAELATARGLRRLTALAEADRVSFYELAGFEPKETLRTLLAPPAAVRGPTGARRPGSVETLPPAPWTRPKTRAVGGWLQEAWEGTADRQTYAVGAPPRAWAHVSREGKARLIHRVLLTTEPAPGPTSTPEEKVLELVSALSAALSPSAPLLFYGLPSVSPITALLQRAGWTCVQESTRMVRPLGLPKEP